MRASSHSGIFSQPHKGEGEDCSVSFINTLPLTTKRVCFSLVEGVVNELTITQSVIAEIATIFSEYGTKLNRKNALAQDDQ